MPRRPRLSGNELYHHIYAWGNNREDVFSTHDHYDKYLYFLFRFGPVYHIDIIAYALMKTHVHLFLFDRHDTISKFMNNLHGEYAQYYNFITGHKGHVFGERYNNKIVQMNNYALHLSRYIHRQAVDAGLVDDPLDYAWTSYHVYLGLKKNVLIKKDVILKQFGNNCDQCEKNYMKFMFDGKNDPVDWSGNADTIIGDPEFKNQIIKKRQKEENETTPTILNNNEEIINIAINEIKVPRQVLLSPRGWKEKKLRHQAYIILIKKHGYSIRQIANAFQVTPMAVYKVIR